MKVKALIGLPPSVEWKDENTVYETQKNAAIFWLEWNNTFVDSLSF